MRTGTALALALVLGFPAAAGCGEAATAPATSAGELVVWADAGRVAALEPVAEAYGRANGVTVRLTTLTGDGQATFVTAAQQGTGPDVVVGPHDWTGSLVRNGAIEPVRLTAAQRADYPPSVVSAVTWSGQTYAVPYAVENLALIRNVDLAPRAPRTVEELVDAGGRLKRAGRTSEALCLPVGQNGDSYHIFPLYTSAGGYLFGTAADGAYDPADLGFGKAGSVAAFTKIRALGEAGAGVLRRSIGGENAKSMFLRGRCPYFVSGPWAVGDIKKAGIAYAIDPIPGFDGGAPARPFLGVQAFFVAAKGRNRLLAQSFVTGFANDPDLAVELYRRDPRPPALTAALDRVAREDPDAARFAAAGAGGPPMPGLAAMPAIWTTFGKAEAAIIGGADVPSTLRAAARSMSAQLR